MAHDSDIIGMGLSPVTIDDVPKIVKAKPIDVSWGLKCTFWVFIVIGILAFIQGVFGEHSSSAWISLHVNLSYWLILAAASSCFTAVFHICNAQWARPVRRIFEASSCFFFYCLVPLALLYFGHKHLFSWATHPAPGKEVWLSGTFLYLRDILSLFSFSNFS